MEQDKPNRDRHSYWVERIRQDAPRLNYIQRVGLTKAILSDLCELTSDEVDVFTAATMPSAEEFEKLMLLAQAERKIVRFHSISFFSPEEEDLERRSSPVFRVSFQKVMKDFYASSETEELFSLIKPWEDYVVAVWLIGMDFPMYRHIRNAHLPFTQSLLTLDQSGAHDISGSWFNEQDPVNDPVAQWERFLHNI